MYFFEELNVWKKARELRLEVRIITRNFPPEEKFRLVDQLIRSSRSVTNNIAEGFGRYYYKENRQFCRKARGSLFETLDHMICSLDDGYITQNVFNDIRKLIEECLRLLNGYINYLSSAKPGKE
jgi:four helix bundle protein